MMQIMSQRPLPAFLRHISTLGRLAVLAVVTVTSAVLSEPAGAAVTMSGSNTSELEAGDAGDGAVHASQAPHLYADFQCWDHTTSFNVVSLLAPAPQIASFSVLLDNGTVLRQAGPSTNHLAYIEAPMGTTIVGYGYTVVTVGGGVEAHSLPVQPIPTGTVCKYDQLYEQPPPGSYTTTPPPAPTGAHTVYASSLASDHGSTGSSVLAAPLVGIASTASGAGYWLLGADGGVFSYGDARFHGSTGATKLNQPIVGIAADPTGRGYWFVAADGGVFSFGAPFHGSTGSMRLNSPIVGMAPTRTGNGYWLVARDGGVFSFGDASFSGSTSSTPINHPIVGMAADPDGTGYWLVDAGGGVFSFDTPFAGPPVGHLGFGDWAVGIAANPGGGYWVITQSGGTYAYGGALFDDNHRTGQSFVGVASHPTNGGYWVVTRGCLSTSSAC